MKKFSHKILTYRIQINKDMAFWIKYRPSRWLSFIPKRLEKVILRFIDKKNSKQFIFYTALIFCFIFVGFVPTINFIFSNFWRLWLIPIFICMIYWLLAVVAIYSRVIFVVLRDFILSILEKWFIGIFYFLYKPNP